MNILFQRWKYCYCIIKTPLKFVSATISMILSAECSECRSMCAHLLNNISYCSKGDHSHQIMHVRSYLNEQAHLLFYPDLDVDIS